MHPISIRVKTENYCKTIVVTEEDIKVFNQEGENGNTSKL